MNIKIFILSVVMSSVAFIANAVVDVSWSVIENAKVNDEYFYVQRFTVRNHYGVKRLCFNMFARKMEAVNPSDKVVEIIPGYYYIESNRFGNSEPLDIDIKVKGWIQSCNYAPDGLHAVTGDGHLLSVKYKRNSLLLSPELRNRPGRDVMTYGDSIYKFNETLKDDSPLGVYDIVPSFKSVKLGEGSYIGTGEIFTSKISHSNYEFYRISVSQDSIMIEGASEEAIKMAQRVLQNQLLAENGGKLPCAVIEDYPDYHYRALMIDVARNFISLPDVQKIVYQMASLRLNRLHFHLTDDEAWRIEIPGLPELTAVSSRRGYTLDESEFLAQIFAGDGNPNSTDGTANGYYTREEFIQFLMFCHSLGIEVIPEVDVPGHSRAAIKAMESRFRKTGDDTYRLCEDGDTSRYTSAQAFHDNLMNPALPGPYKFMEKVIDEISSMYKEAGVDLLGFHIGGDEVPEGAWDGSPSAIKMMQERGISGRHQLQGVFVRRMAEILSQKGIKMFGWQEIGVGYDDEFNKVVAPVTAGVNCWLTNSSKMKNVALRAIDSGFPVILSNVEHFYMDQLYASHPEERGLYWGGIVDEFVSLSGYPDELCPADSLGQTKILGVSGQLFGETIRSMAIVQRQLFPKVYGLAERAWNKDYTYSNAKFNQIIGAKLLPRLSLGGSAFHLRTPGIIVENGYVKINSAYPGAKIRYTLDGTDPDYNSPIYETPVPVGNAAEIRAVAYYLTEKSLVSLLYVK